MRKSSIDAERATSLWPRRPRRGRRAVLDLRKPGLRNRGVSPASDSEHDASAIEGYVNWPVRTSNAASAIAPKSRATVTVSSRV